jgi:hypothetical protein
MSQPKFTSKFEEVAAELLRKVEQLLSPYGWEVEMRLVHRVRLYRAIAAQFRFKFVVRRMGHLLHLEQFGHSAELCEEAVLRNDKRYVEELPRRWASDVHVRTAGMMAERCVKVAWREVPVPPLQLDQKWAEKSADVPARTLALFPYPDASDVFPIRDVSAEARREIERSKSVTFPYPGQSGHPKVTFGAMPDAADDDVKPDHEVKGG